MTALDRLDRYLARPHMLPTWLWLALLVTAAVVGMGIAADADPATMPAFGQHTWVALTTCEWPQ